MKETVLKFETASKFTRVFEWIKIIAITGFAQVSVQIVSLLCGIVIVRQLSTQEYALYILTNTVLGAMSVLADPGISTGVIAQGGKVWFDREKLGIVVVTGFQLQRKFESFSLLIFSPILIYLLVNHGAQWFHALIILGSVLPLFYTTRTSNLLQIAPRLKQDIISLQKNQVITNVIRLVFTIFAVYSFPYAFIGLITGGLPQIWSNKNLRKISDKYVNLNQKANPDFEKKLLEYVKRLLPHAVYFALSSQIVVWIISFSGSASFLAQIGALGRLIMILNIITILVNTLVTPVFAKLSADPKILLRNYIQIQVGMIIICGVVIGSTILFPEQILWVLGKKYSDLKNELVLNVIGSCLILISGVSFSLSSSRGWVIKPIIGIAINLLVILISVSVLDLSVVKGVLLLNIVIGANQLVVSSFYMFYKISKSD